MAKCKGCIHYDVCSKEGRMVQVDEHTWNDYNQLDDVERFCDNYIAADVVPKSEVEVLRGLYQKALEKADRYRFNLEEVLKERSESAPEEIYYGGPRRGGEMYVRDLDERLRKARQKVAREIFEEIERETKNHGITYTQRKIAELKKKYTDTSPADPKEAFIKQLVDNWKWGEDSETEVKNND